MDAAGDAAGLRADGGDVDDAAMPLLLHGGSEGTHHAVGPGEVGVEDALPLGQVNLGIGAGADKAGIVEQDIGAAPARKDGVGGVGNRLIAAHIHRQGQDAVRIVAPQVGGDGVELVGAAGEKGDGCTGAVKL